MRDRKPLTRVGVFVVGVLFSMGLGFLLAGLFLYARGDTGQQIKITPTPFSNDTAQHIPVPSAVGTTIPLAPEPIRTVGDALNSATREAFETGTAHMNETSAPYATEDAQTVVAIASIAQASPIPTCPPVWKIVDTPDLGTRKYSDLNAIAAITPDDIWAVGFQRSLDAYGLVQDEYKTLTMHWDGKQWSIVPSPSNDVGNSVFTALAAISYDDVWAIGTWIDNNMVPHEQRHALAAHWDGTQWKRIAAPDVDGMDAVAAIRTNDIWAVGTDTMHWDGSAWTAVPNPDSQRQAPHAFTMLKGVTALSAGNILAVGSRESADNDKPLYALSWDGSRWSLQDIPVPDLGDKIRGSSIEGAVALAPDDIWAVGGTDYADFQYPLILHKTDSWHHVSIPDLTLPGASLRGIAAASANDLWAVGGTTVYSSDSTKEVPLALHWDGTRWTPVAAANADTCHCGVLNDVIVLSSGDVWAVGQGDASHPLIEHLDHPIDRSAGAGGCPR